jgi:hypothetical protein
VGGCKKVDSQPTMVLKSISWSHDLDDLGNLPMIHMVACIFRHPESSWSR